MCTPLFRDKNTETRELSVYPAEPNQIKGKIKRSTAVMDLFFFIFVPPSLINMHNKYFWTSTLLGVPKWESIILWRLSLLLYLCCPQGLSQRLRLHPATLWAKQLHLKCFLSANTADQEQKRKGKIMHDQLSEEWEIILMNPKRWSTALTGTCALQS